MVSESIRHIEEVCVTKQQKQTTDFNVGALFKPNILKAKLLLLSGQYIY